MKKKNSNLKYDDLTEAVRSMLERIPRVGSILSRIYMWKNMMFNFMLIGATGLIVNWLLYEGLLRGFFVYAFGGTFIALAISTFIVFLWNYFWNWKFSLSMEAQVASMKRDELVSLRGKVEAALSQKFSAKGERMDG